LTAQSSEQRSHQPSGPQANVPSGNDSDEIPPVITALLNSVLVQFVRSKEGEDTVVHSEVVPRDRVEQYLQQVRLAGYGLDDVRFQESAEEQPQDEATRGLSQDVAQDGAEPGEDGAEDIGHIMCKEVRTSRLKETIPKILPSTLPYWAKVFPVRKS
jgi:hypothetical protein